MRRDTSLDDPVLRVAQASSQLFAWFDLHGGPPADGVHRAIAHLLCHAATDDPGHAQAARAALQALLAAELPVALSARAALGDACLQANEVLGDRLFLDAACSLCEGIAQGTRLERGDALCFSAIPGRVLAVHHANLQAAALLARTGHRVGDSGFIGLARRAVAYALALQRPDGAWLHGEERPLRWVDRFHAGSRVSSLLELAQFDLHPAVHPALARALRHLVELHFDATGVPHVLQHEDEPGECELLVAGEAMGALARVALTEPRAGRRAARLAAALADWSTAHLQAWSLWRDPPSVHGPGRLLEALVRVQALGPGAWQVREVRRSAPSRQSAMDAYARHAVQGESAGQAAPPAHDAVGRLH